MALEFHLAGPRLAFFAIGALLVLCCPASGAPDHIRLYKTGVEAAEARDWKQVEKMMGLAIEGKSEEKRGWAVMRRGYFPHYFLGLARYHQGDCRSALAAWAESERQGAIVGRGEYTELLRLQSDCQKNGKPSARSASSPAAASNGTTGKEKVRTGQLWVEKGADPTRKALGAIESVAPDSEVGRAASRGQKVVDVAEVGTEIVDLALPPAQALEGAIDAFFTGNPGRTIQMLQEIDISDPRAKAQVYLFRSAAYFRLHHLAGGDSARLELARKFARLFQQEQWRGDFPADLFDPRFVRFLRSSG